MTILPVRLSRESDPAIHALTFTLPTLLSWIASDDSPTTSGQNVRYPDRPLMQSDAQNDKTPLVLRAWAWQASTGRQITELCITSPQTKGVL